VRDDVRGNAIIPAVPGSLQATGIGVEDGVPVHEIGI
jgi:hypothetical protein